MDICGKCPRFLKWIFSVKKGMDYDKEKHREIKIRKSSTCQVVIKEWGRSWRINSSEVDKCSCGIHTSACSWLRRVILVSRFRQFNKDTDVTCLITWILWMVWWAMWRRSGFPSHQYGSWDVLQMAWRICGLGDHYKEISGIILHLDRKVDVWKCWRGSIVDNIVG